MSVKLESIISIEMIVLQPGRDAETRVNGTRTLSSMSQLMIPIILPLGRRRSLYLQIGLSDRPVQKRFMNLSYVMSGLGNVYCTWLEEWPLLLD
jgi:hypothetical protein